MRQRLSKSFKVINKTIFNHNQYISYKCIHNNGFYRSCNNYRFNYRYNNINININEYYNFIIKYFIHNNGFYRYNYNRLYNIMMRCFNINPSKDYYNILGIKNNATKKEVRNAYLKLAKKWHPDVHKSESDKKNAREKFMLRHII